MTGATSPGQGCESKVGLLAAFEDARKDIIIVQVDQMEDPSTPCNIPDLDPITLWRTASVPRLHRVLVCCITYITARTTTMFLLPTTGALLGITYASAVVALLPLLFLTWWALQAENNLKTQATRLLQKPFTIATCVVPVWAAWPPVAVLVMVLGPWGRALVMFQWVRWVAGVLAVLHAGLALMMGWDLVNLRREAVAALQWGRDAEGPHKQGQE